MLAGRMQASFFKSLNGLPWTQPSWAPKRRLRLGVLAGAFAACYLFGFAYHVVAWYHEAPLHGGLGALYHVVTIAGYLALWRLVTRLLRKRASTPISAFWTVLLSGVLALALGAVVWSVGPPERPDFDGTSLTLISIARMHVLSLLEAGFFFVLLARFRQLVLYKRTRRSQRNWYLLLSLMALAGLSAVGRAPQADVGALQAVFIVPAVLLMVACSFRLSWIIFLSFREKMTCMALAGGLLMLLIIGSATSGEGFVPGSVLYLDYYSYPLSLFVTLSMAFGILYSLTALLSLLFHLPTTTDFQRKADEMAAMHSLTHLVSQAFDAEKLAASIVASPVEAGSAHAAYLVRLGEDGEDDEDEALPMITAAHGAPPDRLRQKLDLGALTAEVRRTRAPLLLDEAPADARVHAAAGEGFDSLLMTPLIARDVLLGVLVTTKEVMQGFEKDDVEAISILAAQAALALDHAQLFEEQIEKERLARELDIAREVQRKLLPSRLPAPPGVALAAASVSAQEVGGDYYDFAELDDGRLAFIIADVSGKGTSAAFYMAELQGIFHSASRLAPAPADFLTHANAALSHSLEQGVFISGIYGVIDPEREEIVLARAGHCPAATIDWRGEARFLRAGGMGLGLHRGPLFRQSLTEERCPLKPGDAFAFYTDGVVESRDAAGEEYGYDRFLRSLRAHRHEDAGDLHEALLTDLHAFIGHESYDDDMTLVVFKWHGLGLPVPSAREVPAREVSAREVPDQAAPADAR